MKKFILLLSFFLSSFAYGENSMTIDSTTVVTPEGFGQYLSELLINRGDIKESPIAISINTLLPNEDFSKYEDSPANLILSILKGYEISLPKSWDRLLYNADKLKLDNNTNYLKTFFSKTHNEKYKCVSVLKHETKFYALSFEVLTWKKDSSYIINVNDKLVEFKTIDKLLKDYLKNLYVLEKVNTDANSEHSAYKYNKNVCVKIKNKIIPSLNIFIDKLTHAIIENQTYDTFSAGQKSINGKELGKNWTNLISYFKENGCSDLQCSKSSIDNVSLEDSNLYNVFLVYKFTSKDKTYKFTCLGELVAGSWNLMKISSIEEEPEFKLQF